MQLAEVLSLSRRPLPPFSRVLLNVTLVLVTWDLRRRTRKDLRSLSAHMLSDIGIDPQRAAVEGDKPFWVA